jgi:hypothetical protein
MERRAQAGLLALSFALAAGSGAVREGAMAHAIAAESYEDRYYLPPASWMPVLSLGWRSAVSDLLWTNALVYFGDEFVHGGRAVHVFDYTDAMLALDPDFRAVYHWIGTAGMYHVGQVTPEDVRRSAAVMRDGLQRAPDDGALAWALGSALAFELPPLLQDERERAQARSEGADYLAIAVRLGAAPSWALLSSAGLMARIGRNDAAIRHLEEMYSSVSDEGVRAEIEAGIAALRSQAEAEAFVESSREQESRRLRELPYVSEDLYFILGPRPVLDWRASYRDGYGSLIRERSLDAFHSDSP